MREALRSLLSTSVLGAAFGVADTGVNAITSRWTGIGAELDATVLGDASDVGSLVLDAPWAWAVVAGSLCPRPTLGSAGGVACLAAATVGYFLGEAAWAHDGVSTGEMTYWIIASIVVGPILGACGQVARRRDLPGLGCRLAAPVGVAVWTIVQPMGFHGDLPVPPQAGAEVARIVALAGAGVAIAVFLVVHLRRPASAAGDQPTAAGRPGPARTAGP